MPGRNGKGTDHVLHGTRQDDGSDTEDILFRYRTLLSAQKVLESKLEAVSRGRGRNGFQAQHMRRLKRYLGRAIFIAEQELKARQIDPSKATVIGRAA